MIQTVAVVGAGSAGLAAVKCCLDEGLQPTCFEISDDIGGLWYYTEKVEEGRTTVMKNTVANLSKEITAYSDFPPPKEHPIYMHHTHLEEYLCMYADKFGLREHIHLNSKVVQISETEDHDISGQWRVKTKDLRKCIDRTETFDAVLVCTGALTKPKTPQYNGLSKFQGIKMHSHEYKTSAGFEGKKTLVVGIGNSAVDMAVDTSEVAKQVYLCSRNGTWIFGRLGPSGQPLDFAIMSRFSIYAMSKVPSFFNKMIMKQCNTKIDHTLYGINPTILPLQSTATVNDELPYKLLIGAIKMKPDIKEIHERSVEFVDGTKIDNLDAIVFGTGYEADFPFLSPDIVGEEKSNLFLGMFPPEREKNQTLAVIGCFRQKGPVISVVEMQSRFAARIFKGILKLPNKEAMRRSIKRNIEESQTKRIGSLTGIRQHDFLTFMDELASMIGCKPNLFKLMFTDIELAKACIFGPPTPYQFRLVGPHSWPGAREAILNQSDRTYASLNKGKRLDVVKQKRSFLKTFCIIVTIATVGYSAYSFNTKLIELPAMLKLK